MKEIKITEGKILEPFFKASYDSCPEAFIQGIMGRGFCDSTENPTYGIIQIGNFFYLGGDGSGIEKKNLLSILQNLSKTTNPVFVPLSASWNDLLIKDPHYTKIIRYALNKPSLPSFNTNKLTSYIHPFVYDPYYSKQSIKNEFLLKPIDENLFLTVRNANWSNAFTSNYRDYYSYKKNALGFIIMETTSGKIVSGASSYSSSIDSIELTIATNPNYRNQGLATAVSARMILECLKQNKIPRWDAANLTSVSIAEKMGYHFLEEYICYKTI